MESIPVRKYLPHGSPAWVDDGASFFVTGCCADRRLNRLCHPNNAEALGESIGHYHRCGRWFVHLFLLMPDHWHAILGFPDNRVRKPIEDWKRYVARHHGIPWQRDFFDHRLRNAAEHETKAAYIRQNPVRAGLVRNADDWPYVWDRRNLPDFGT